MPAVLEPDRAPDLTAHVARAFDTLGAVRTETPPTLRVREVGTVASVGDGIARIRGVPSVQADEVVQFESGVQGMAFNLDANGVGVVLLGDATAVEAGETVRRTGRILDVPVGDALLGRVVNALGEPLDGRGALQADARRPIEREAPPIMDRAPVETPLQTGWTVVDALLPIGRGQRELIVGDRQTGKTALALGTIVNQHDTGVRCVYCAIGQRTSSVASVIAILNAKKVLGNTTVVVARGDEPPGLQFAAPYAATTIAEAWMEDGHDVLLVYDDLTRHAQAYRELSLLLQRPPGREAFPGDIFYIHSRLLERATHLHRAHGGGSLTALPIIETEAQNLSAYIPTNLISITDGQIVLSPTLFQNGILPAVDVGRSVSRVGGAAQKPAYRQVAGPLRLSYAQFQELEDFSRFGTRLDEDTRRTLEHGRRVRNVLQQPEHAPRAVSEQIAVLLATTEGLFDAVPLDAMPDARARIRTAITEHAPALRDRIHDGEPLTDALRESLLALAQDALAEWVQEQSE